EIDVRDGSLVKGNVFMTVQKITNGESHFHGAQLCRRDLVKQRLKGLVVIVADERDPHIGVAQALESADAAETGAQDHDVRLICHGCSLSLGDCVQTEVPS